MQTNNLNTLPSGITTTHTGPLVQMKSTAQNTRADKMSRMSSQKRGLGNIENIGAGATINFITTGEADIEGETMEKITIYMIIFATLGFMYVYDSTKGRRRMPGVMEYGICNDKQIFKLKMLEICAVDCASTYVGKIASKLTGSYVYDGCDIFVKKMNYLLKQFEGVLNYYIPYISLEYVDRMIEFVKKLNNDTDILTFKCIFFHEKKNEIYGDKQYNIQDFNGSIDYVFGSSKLRGYFKKMIWLINVYMFIYCYIFNTILQNGKQHLQDIIHEIKLNYDNIKNFLHKDIVNIYNYVSNNTKIVLFDFVAGTSDEFKISMMEFTDIYDTYIGRHVYECDHKKYILIDEKNEHSVEDDKKYNELVKSTIFQETYKQTLAVYSGNKSLPDELMNLPSPPSLYGSKKIKKKTKKSIKKRKSLKKR